MKSGGESLHLLLAIKSLNEGRKDKKYLIKVINLDTNQHCQIDNTFQHNYQYIYKLWPCLLTHSEFLKIEMYEKVIDGKREQLVKRGEASPLVVYSYEGQKFQFSGSKQQRCVLIMKFKVGAFNKAQNQESSLQLQKLNDSIELDLKKHQQQQKYNDKYLQQTNRYLNQLKNDKYLIQSSQKVEKKQKNLKHNDVSNGKDSFYQKDEEYLFEQPKNERRWQKLNNGRYFSYNQKSNHQQTQRSPNNISKSFNLSELQNNPDVADQIRRKRGRYFNSGAIKGNRKRQDQMENQAIQMSLQAGQKSQQQEGLTQEPTYMTFNQRKPSKDTIIRQLNYPITEINDYKPEEKQKKKRRYQSEPKESEQPRGFPQKLKRQSFQHQETKEKNHQQKPQKKKSQQYILQFSQIKSRLYKGDQQISSKLLISYKRSKHSTTIQKPNNKVVSWKNHIRLTNLIPTQFILCKLVSPNQYGFFTEGQVRILISDFLRCKSQNVKVYLYEKNIAVGHLKFSFKISKMPEESKPTTEQKNSERTERRRPSSLPQIANHKKQASQRYSQTISKDDLERLQLKQTQSSRLKRKYSKLIQSPIYEQAKQSLQNRGRSTYFSKIRQKKLKLKARAK